MLSITYKTPAAVGAFGAIARGATREKEGRMSDPDASIHSASGAASKPEVLLIGPYPAWDLEPMEREYTVRRL